MKPASEALFVNLLYLFYLYYILFINYIHIKIETSQLIQHNFNLRLQTFKM